MSEIIGQINAPKTNELLDVEISGPFSKTGLYRLDLVDAEGEFAGQPWMQVGKNVPGYTAKKDGSKYVLLRDYGEAMGYAEALQDAGIVDFTGRVIVVDYGNTLYEAFINDGTEREYEFPVSWEMYGRITVKAKSRAEAVQAAYDKPGLPDGEYSDDSFNVDDDQFLMYVAPEGYIVQTPFKVRGR